MTTQGLEHDASAILTELNDAGAYPRSLVCTEDGLPVATSGDGDVDGDDLAAFTSLFDTVVERATTDLGFQGVDEVTLVDSTHHRIIIRPLPLPGVPRLFLVVWAPRRATWRRNTNRALRYLGDVLAPLTVTPQA